MEIREFYIHDSSHLDTKKMEKMKIFHQNVHEKFLNLKWIKIGLG